MRDIGSCDRPGRCSSHRCCAVKMMSWTSATSLSVYGCVTAGKSLNVSYAVSAEAGVAWAFFRALRFFVLDFGVLPVLGVFLLLDEAFLAEDPGVLDFCAGVGISSARSALESVGAGKHVQTYTGRDASGPPCRCAGVTGGHFFHPSPAAA